MTPADPAHSGTVSADTARNNGRDREFEFAHPDDPDLAVPEAPEQLDAQTQSALEDRYGTGRRNKFNRKFGYGVAGGLVAAGIAFLAFSGWQNASQVSWQDIGYTKTSDYTLDVKFEISGPADTPMACAVEALNEAKATVGWKVIEVPASEKLVRTITTELVVTNPAVTASTNECWVLA